MAIPSRGIGWGTEENLLWQISKQLERLTGVTANSGVSGTSGTSGTSGITPVFPAPLVYGLYSQTSNSTPITDTTEELTLIGAGEGTLSVPANGFLVGDSFRAIVGGELSSNNNQDFRIKVYAGGNVILDSGIQNISNLVSDIFSLDINFTVRATGVAGVASIVTLGDFHYTKQSNGSVEGFAFNTVNNTTFDTTVANTLDIKFQWSAADGSNLIYSDIFVLNKVY
jgi:hypothetical protein